MENYLMNGETDSDNATRDNTTVIDLNDDIGGELENILDCGFSYQDFITSYKAILTVLGNASFDYTFYDFSLDKKLSHTLSDIDDCYYWAKHSKTIQDYKSIKQDWKNDMKIIKDYVEDYKAICQSNDNPNVFLDL